MSSLSRKKNSGKGICSHSSCALSPLLFCIRRSLLLIRACSNTAAISTASKSLLYLYERLCENGRRPVELEHRPWHFRHQRYSFYLLGSPFFWLSTLLPQSAVPYAMVPLLVLKFGVCGLAAYTYLYRYAKTRQAAVIASVLYAFSGFTVYNTFFNHFLDCIALFPLLLWALDEAVLENRKALCRCFWR